MQYRHTFVDGLSKYTKDAQGTFQISIGSRSYRTERTYSHPYWAGDIPVNAELAKFCAAVKKAMPWVEFGVDDDLSFNSVYETSAITFNEVHVYAPGHRYTLGRIGYRDYGIHEVVMNYGVYSRKIIIGKVRDNNRRHTAITSSLPRAVRSASKTLVPYSMFEMANRSYEFFKDKVTDTAAEAAREADKFIRACMDKQVLVAELTNLIRQNATFVTPAFQQAAAHYLTAANEARDVSARKVKAYFVVLSVNPHNNTQIARIVELAAPVQNGGTPLLVEPNGVTVDTQNIPDDIQAKLAVLLSLDDESYVPGVGYRVDDTAFWIEREV